MDNAQSAPRYVPDIVFPDALPVCERRQEIAEAIRDHQVVIVAGETGSGKTTQIPKICLQLGRGLHKRIGHTQPRRIAARTVAQRIADELKTPLGATVGYQVRFNDRVSEQSAIKLMTDGILLAEMQHDRSLSQYDTLIIDEAHERSLNIDFILGYLKQLLPRRPDLKVVVTSATIDVESFSQHFNNAPVIEVSGRTYPVETHYVDAPADREQGMVGQIVELVQAIDAGDYGKRGDVLVFLSGERDIRELAKALRHDSALDVLPLYARLSQAEQNRVFNLAGRRGTRVVLATNVAETSLTVPGIRYVIDPGEARISRYSYRTKVQRLPIEPISQASANQRQGRCGRVEAGVCIRLYSQQDFLARPEFTDPEIKRTNLAAVILQMLQLRLGEVDKFPFIDPPDSRMVRDGYKLLEELGAVSTQGRITAIGRQMARLPVDPRMGRMVLAAHKLGSLEQVLVIASALTVQDPRERPTDKQQQSDQQHARFRHPKSDFMAWLNLWRYYEEQRQSLSQNQLRKLCQREFLSFMRMREWREVHAQLSIACRQQKMRPRPQLPDEERYEPVHRALLSGLLSNIAQQFERREYLGARNRKLHIFPGSSQHRKPPPWIVAAEIVETSKVFARGVAAIEPQWVIDINPDLLKHHYYEPRWQQRSGRAVAWERLSLYGLTVADKRSVHYGKINRAEARELLIREGLIAGKYARFPAFLKHNQRLVREVEELESRSRRRDILADDRVLFEFYDERLPADVVTAAHLEAWLKDHQDGDASLRVSRELLITRDPGDSLGEQFPDQLTWEDVNYRLSYQFEPGNIADGVSITVPVALLNRVPRYLFDWLVPGLLREKCIQLVKSLPKQQRKHLVPAPDYVDRMLEQVQPDNVDLLTVMARSLSQLGGIRLRPEDWAASKLDDYYQMNVRVVDSRGKLMAQGRDLDALIRQFREDTQLSVSTAPSAGPQRTGITRWDFDELPREWRFRQAGVAIVSYPALADKGDTVAIELCDYPAQARQQHRLGVLKLGQLANSQGLRYLRKQLLRGNEYNLVLAGSNLERATLLEDLVDAVFVQSLELDAALPYTRTEYEQALENSRGALAGIGVELEKTLLNTLQVLVEVRKLLAAAPVGQWRDSVADIESQLAGLLGSAFLRDTPAAWINQYPRYLKALRNRLERLSGQYAKDQQHMAMLEALQIPLLEVLQERPDLLHASDAAAQYRWALEEFRVSLFAQNLGTRMPVSQKRLQEQWQRVADWLRDNPH